MNSINPTRQITQETGVPLEWRVGDLIINTYEVKQVFTTGGMALVYRVHHRGWDIDLAVKSPRQEILNLEGSAENIAQEAENWINLGLHPHIVACYYVRVLGKVPRIFMEYADAGSLSDAIEQQRLYAGSPDEVVKRILDIAIQCAWGLHYAHEKGLIHQDMKPPNVLLTREGIAKVTDFGIAQAKATIHAREAAFSPLEAAVGDKSIRVDTLGMTPAYCSPEQANMESLSRRTDIWSWAVSVMEMFTGKKSWGKGPFAKDGLEKLLKSGPEIPIIPRMPDDLAGVLFQCFALNPDDRPRDMETIGQELQNIYARRFGKPYPRREPRIDTILADTLNNRAVSMVDLHRDDDATRYFDQAIQAEPNHSAAFYNRCLFLWRAGRLTDQDVVSGMHENIKTQVENWYPYYLLGLIHLERGDASEANKIIDTAIAKFGELPPIKSLAGLTQRMISNAGGCLRIFRQNDTPVNAVALTRNGELALSGGNDGAVRLWRVASSECLKTLVGHTHLVHAVRFSQGGGFALSASWDHTLRLWHLPSGTCVKIFEGHEDLVQDVVMLPDGKHALSASADTTLRLWDLQEGACVGTMAGHRDTVWSVVVSNDGRYAVSNSYDNTLRRWDLGRKTCVGKIDWTKSCTSNLSLTPDGQNVVLAAGDNRIYLIDLATGQPVRSFAGHPGGTTVVSVAPNGVWVLSGGLDGTIRLWDMATGRCLRTFLGHTSSVNSLSICPEKMLAISGSNDRAVRVWRLATGGRAPYVTVQPRSTQELVGLSTQLEQILSQAEDYYDGGDFTGALDLLAQARSNPEYRRTPRLLTDWDRVGRKGSRQKLNSTWLVQSFRAHAERPNTVAFSEDPRIGVTGGEDGLLKLWNFQTGSSIRPFDGHTGPVNCGVISVKQNRAISASSDGTLRVWKLDDGACPNTLAGHTSEVNSVVISPDGRLALSGSNDNTLRLWNLEQGTSVRTLKGHTHYVRCAAFTPDGRLGLSASWDKTLRLWDLASGESLKMMAGHDEVIDALAISPDGRVAVSGGLDRSLRVWDLETGSTVRVIPEIAWRVKALVFSPDGRTLFAGEEDGSIEVWDVRDGKRVRSVKGHSQPVNSLSISPDGCLMASVSSDRFLKLWRLDWDYAIPAEKNIDPALNALLNAFIYRHRPLAPDGIGRAGRASWEEADLAGLMTELGYRGYGNLNTGDVTGILKQIVRQAGG